MLLLDLLRPYLIRHSLSNTLLMAALALPLTLLLVYSGHRIRAWVPIQGRGHGLLLFTIGAPPMLAMWLVPQLAEATASLRSNPTTLLLFGLSPLLASWISPVVGYYWAEMALTASRSIPHRQSYWNRGLSITSLCICLLATNVGAPLLLTGGMPFNATHTVASWLFQMVWVNGDLASGVAIGALLGIGILVVVGIGTYLSGRGLKEEIWHLLLVGFTPGWLVTIPWIYRVVGVTDGRWPLWWCDVVSTAWLFYWISRVRGSRHPRLDGRINQDESTIALKLSTHL